MNCPVFVYRCFRVASGGKLCSTLNDVNCAGHLCILEVHVEGGKCAVLIGQPWSDEVRAAINPYKWFTSESEQWAGTNLFGWPKTEWHVWPIKAQNKTGIEFPNLENR